MDTPPTNKSKVEEHDFPAILKQIHEEVQEHVEKGEVADYIDALAGVPKSKFGMAVAMLDGDVYTVGDAEECFSIQSISKVYSLTMALDCIGADLWKRCGREPSGNSFNSLVQLEHENGIPRNPFINAGALVVADVLAKHFDDPKQAILDFVRARSGDDTIESDAKVKQSEYERGHRNAALVHFMRSFDNIDCEVDDVLDVYNFHCSLRMHCADLARSFLYLANRGQCRHSDCRVIDHERAKRINALMLTCGTYDAAGDFAFHVGLPAKSGVGGGIVGVIPNVAAISVWSPGLDSKGNSLAGGIALDRFTQLTELSVF
jgi:glutaminase